MKLHFFWLIKIKLQNNSSKSYERIQAQSPVLIVFLIVQSKNIEGLKKLILAFWRCFTYQKLQRIKFAELEKMKPKMNTTKPNYICISIEQSLSLNLSLWIVSASVSDIFNKMDTSAIIFFISEQKLKVIYFKCRLVVCQF